MPEQKRPPQRSKKSGPFVGNAAWDDFVDWCKARNLKPVPANAWTLAAYIRACEGRMSLKKLQKHVADIGKAHAEKSKRRPERDPLIAKTFQIMERRAKARDDQSELFDAESLLTDKTASGAAPTNTTRPKSSSKAGKTSARSRVMSTQPKLVRKRRLK